VVSGISCENTESHESGSFFRWVVSSNSTSSSSFEKKLIYVVYFMLWYACMCVFILYPYEKFIHIVPQRIYRSRSIL
jgi:hypothetical protein